MFPEQGFLGPNCTQTSGSDGKPAVQCACLHLTDFSAKVRPHLSMASASQMTSLNPNDIFTKLKFLAAIIFGMFGFM